VSDSQLSAGAEVWRYSGKYLEVVRRGPKDVGVPLVLVHGVCHGAWCWDGYVSFFAERGYDTIALSLRGHGGSSGRHELHRFGLADYVDDVADGVGALDHKPVLVGHSMGGSIVQRYLADRARTVRAAVLFASATAGGLGGRRFADVLRQNRPTGLFNALRVVAGRTSTADQIKNSPFFSGRLTAEDAAAHAKRLGPESRRAVRDLVRSFTAVPRRLPPMLVIGSRGDELFGEASQGVTARAYGTTPTLLEDLCHDMMLDPDSRRPPEELLAFLEVVTR
jgi:pimeloyl-ACP methyl ester carboxylesterase